MRLKASYLKVSKGTVTLAQFISINWAKVAGFFWFIYFFKQDCTDELDYIPIPLGIHPLFQSAHLSLAWEIEPSFKITGS